MVVFYEPGFFFPLDLDFFEELRLELRLVVPLVLLAY